MPHRYRKECFYVLVEAKICVACFCAVEAFGGIDNPNGRMADHVGFRRSHGHRKRKTRQR